MLFFGHVGISIASVARLLQQWLPERSDRVTVLTFIFAPLRLFRQRYRGLEKGAHLLDVAIDNAALMNAFLDAAEEKLISTAEEHTPTHDQRYLITFLDSKTMVSV